MNRVRQLWEKHAVAYGTFITIPSVRSVEAIGQAGYDWVVFEQQHGHVTQETLLPLFHAIELGGATPIVRVGENDFIGIARALDLGARGVIVPMINTPEQAEKVSSAMKYAPTGTRSYASHRHFTSPAESDADVICIVMIESVEGVSNIDAIASTPGIDAVLFGPADFAISAGLTPADAGLYGRAPHETVSRAAQAIAQACKRHGLHLGQVIGSTPQAVQNAMNEGADLIALGSDLNHILAGAKSDLAMVREANDNREALS